MIRTSHTATPALGRIACCLLRQTTQYQKPTAAAHTGGGAPQATANYGSTADAVDENDPNRLYRKGAGMCACLSRAFTVGDSKPFLRGCIRTLSPSMSSRTMICNTQYIRGGGYMRVRLPLVAHIVVWIVEVRSPRWVIC